MSYNPFPTTSSGSPVSVTGAQELRVALEATQLFYDSFDTGLDTTTRWTSGSGGSGTAPTNAAGGTTLTGGTTANGYSVLTSQVVFPPSKPGWLYCDWNIGLESPVLTTGYRFWGFGTTPGTPTVSAPLTDAAGWEITTAGKLMAVMYAGGTRNLIADLSSSGTNKQPADAAGHNYFMYFRGDNTFWSIDTLDNVVASTTTGAPGPNVNSLPLKAIAISNSGTAENLNVNAVVVGDTARNAQAIADGTYGWRKASVSAANALKVDGSAVTQPVSGTFWQATQPVSGTVTATQATGTNLHAVIDSGAITVSQATGSNLHAVIDSGAITVSQATGTNLHAVIDSGAITVSQATGTNLHAVIDSTSSGGLTAKSVSGLTVANIKAGNGNLYGVSIYNPNASVIYLQFYNTSGTPTLGTGVAWFLSIPASSVVNFGPGAPAMAAFSTGIAVGASTTPTSTGTPATAPNITCFYA